MTYLVMFSCDKTEYSAIKDYIMDNGTILDSGEFYPQRVVCKMLISEESLIMLKLKFKMEIFSQITSYRYINAKI